MDFFLSKIGNYELYLTTDSQLKEIMNDRSYCAKYYLLSDKICFTKTDKG